LVGVAVKVTLVPEQILLSDAKMLTDGVRLGFTTMVIALDVAVAIVKQVALDVNTQVTMSPLAKLDEVNVVLFVPAFTLFTFHW